jgi:beta-galactosidase
MYLGEDHPKGKDCKTFSIPAFNGLAQILIQSSDEAGTLQLSCESDGLKTSTIQIVSL